MFHLSTMLRFSVIALFFNSVQPVSGQVPFRQYDWPPRWQMNRIENAAPVTPDYGYRSYAFAPPAPVAPTNAFLDVRVPTPNARIWVDGRPTRQSGTDREYISPPLAFGQRYQYTSRARWSENGKPKDQTRVVKFQAGEHLDVYFPTRR